MEKRKVTKQAKTAVSPTETEAHKKGKQALAKKVKAEKTKKAPEISPEEETALLRILAVLEVGFLAVIADGELTGEEIEHLGQNFAVWLEQDLTSEDLFEVLGMFKRQFDEDGMAGRLAYLGKVLDKDDRRIAFDFACLLSAVDGDVSEDEIGVLNELGNAFHIPNKEANQRFNEIYKLVLADG
jgi:tellurite resistance protein